MRFVWCTWKENEEVRNCTISENILLTKLCLLSDGSPVKNIQKECFKKGDGVGGLKGHLSSASRGLQQQAGSHQEATPQQPKSDEPTDCYLKDLYNQVNSVVMSKPDERDNVNEGEARVSPSLKWSQHCAFMEI